MKYAEITEAKVPQTLWFHGSKYDTADELRINPPSPEKIFFVAKNLDYAKYYANENQHKRKDNSSIYVCALKDQHNGLKIFNLLDESGHKTRKEFGEYCVLESLHFAGMYLRNSNDIFEKIIAFVSDCCKPIIESKGDIKEIKKTSYIFRDTKDYVIEKYIEELPIFLNKVNLTEKDILTKNNVENGIAIREAYCKFWKKIGLNAFDTFETQPTGMSRCLGIFDVSALDSIYAISIPYDVIKKSKELNSDKAIKEFLKNYTVKNS